MPALVAVGLFTLAEAQAELARLLPVLDEIVRLRADAAELAAGGSSLGGLPEFKAAQARLDELMETVQETGAELKGFAPLLVDFPSRWTASRCCCAGSKATGAGLVPPGRPGVRGPPSALTRRQTTAIFTR